jgi:CheY-like chemotaxis protein
MTSRKRILVIEDDDASAGDYVRWLREADYAAERASARADGLDKARQDAPDAILLDLQIPSAPGRADEHVSHGLATLDDLLHEDPFRPIVIISAHSGNRALTREVLQRTRGGQFVFKDADDLERELLRAVDIALASPAYRMSLTVREFRALVEQERPEDEYRRFLAQHWQALLGPEYRECRSPYTISRGAEIDILAIRHDGFPDLWELKRPGDPLLCDYNKWKHHSPECARALGQLMHYCDLAEKEPPWGNNYDMRRGVSMQLHRPRGIVVIGRYRDDAERERLRLENRFLAGLTIMTYDDLVERAESFLRFLQQYRNGDAGDGR